MRKFISLLSEIALALSLIRFELSNLRKCSYRVEFEVDGVKTTSEPLSSLEDVNLYIEFFAFPLKCSIIRIFQDSGDVRHSISRE